MQVNEKNDVYRHPFMKAAVPSKYEIRFLRVNEVKTVALKVTVRTSCGRTGSGQSGFCPGTPRSWSTSCHRRNVAVGKEDVLVVVQGRVASRTSTRHGVALRGQEDGAARRGVLFEPREVLHGLLGGEGGEEEEGAGTRHQFIQAQPALAPPLAALALHAQAKTRCSRPLENTEKTYFLQAVGKKLQFFKTKH
jgi:hypothetical protein